MPQQSAAVSAQSEPAATPWLSARRLGGATGNEILTSSLAVVLTMLLAAEGLTILALDRLRTPHMLIGLVLIPPVLVKLGSTGYRFTRYYTGARPYRAKGPPLLPLRLVAPVLVAATLGVFGSGIALLASGHHSDTLVQLHQASFVVWAACFAVHFLAHLPKMGRSLATERGATLRRATPGAGLRNVLLVAAVLAGVVLAVMLLGPITGWQGENFG